MTADQIAFLAAVNGATQGAATMAAAMAAVVRKAVASGHIASGVPALNTVLAEIIRQADGIATVDRDTRAVVKLVIGSAASVKATAQATATQLRLLAQSAAASTGRVESAYQAGTGDIVTDASLANVVRAGLGVVYAANEAARQLNQIAGKIKL